MQPERKMLNLGCGSRYNSDWVNVDFHSSNPSVMELDLRKHLPFEDNFFDIVYSSHVLEHLPRSIASSFVGECFRVLKEGGIIRIVVPDLETIARIYIELVDAAYRGDTEAKNKYEWIVIEMLDQMVRNHSGGEMLKYWTQNPMPAEDFVIERVGSEVLNVINRLRSMPSGQFATAELEESDPSKIGSFRASGEVHQWMYDRYSLRFLLEKAGFTSIRQCKAEESAIPNYNSYLLDIEHDGSVRKPDSLFMEAVKTNII